MSLTASLSWWRHKTDSTQYAPLIQFVIIVIFICSEHKINETQVHNNEQMIKSEQDSKVENHTYWSPWIEKNPQNLHNTLQLNTMEENITVIKTTMAVLAKN